MPKKSAVQQAVNTGVVRYDVNKGFECVVCGSPLTGEASVAQHLEGSKHREAAARYAITHCKDGPQSLLALLPSNTMAAAKKGIIIVTNNNATMCTICGNTLTGIRPTEAHLAGDDHKKKVDAQRLASTITQPKPPAHTPKVPNTPPVRAPPATYHLTDSHLKSAVQQAVNTGVVRYDVNKGFECVVCGSPLSGEASVAQHLEGSKHREAAARYAITHCKDGPQSLLALLPPNTMAAAKKGIIIITDNDVFKCTICGNTLSGIRPIEDHLAGDDHKKKADAQQLASIFTQPKSPVHTPKVPITPPVRAPPASYYLTDSHLESAVQQAVNTGVVRYDVNKGFECVVCGSPLSGEASVAQHLEGSKHREAAARYAITHCKDGPQSLLALLPPNTMAAAKKGIIIITDNDVFKCTICGNTLSGIRPIEDHLAGDDHKKKADAQQLASIFTQPKSPVHTPKVPITPTVRAPPASYHLTDIDLIETKLRDGIIISTDDKTHPFICPVCSNKSFNSSATLLDHLRSKKHQHMEENSRRTATAGSEAALLPGIVGLVGERTLEYSVLSEPRGHVYVFNYTFPGQGSNWQRSGADKDSHSLHETFTQMGYQVFILKDLTGEETYEEFDRIVRNPSLNGIDSLIMCFLSHGKDPYTFYANDKEELDLFKIRQNFTDRKCPFMKRKPKIFFTNYCRGDQMEKKALDAIEVPNDVVTIHAATEGIMARRSVDHGTCFVRSLCEVLRQYACGMELRDIYTHLEYTMKEKNGTKPMWEDYGFKRFYFIPR